MPPIDHECVLTTVVVELSNELEKLKHELAQMKKARFGQKSERTKMPRPTAGETATADEQLATRRANAESKANIQTLNVEHKVPDAERTCPACGNEKLRAIGKGRASTVFEFVPARFERHVHVQEVLRCGCGDYVVTAPGVPKVIEKGRYGAGFLAHLAVAKCADHLPMYRLEKDFARQGFPLKRSTMNELLHRASEITRPLSRRLLDVICERHVVQADETPLRMQNDGAGKAKTGFMWTFAAADDTNQLDVGYVYTASRSGETPKRLLEGTSGVHLVDGYSGYNAVENVSTRTRAACHAHVRRKFHDALATAPIAQEAIDLILALYRVEHDVNERGIAFTHEHLAMRQDVSAKAHARLRAWLDRERPRHPPKSPISTAIRYALGQWDALAVFLTDARVPLDNNASERSLRRVALGRKNYLFVGDVDAGSNIAGLYTLIATCEARAINPFAYLSDVIARVQDHPARQLDELLPGAWAAARAA